MIIPFPGRRIVRGEPIDVAPIAFRSEADLALLLQQGVQLQDPTAVLRVVVAVASGLLDPALTEQQATAGGWADLATARQRGMDMLAAVVAVFPR